MIDPRRAGRDLIHAITDLTWMGDCMNIHPIVFMSGYGQPSLRSALMLQMDRRWFGPTALLLDGELMNKTPDR